MSIPTWLCVCALLGGCAETPAAPTAPTPAAFLPLRQNRPPLEIGVLVASWHTGLVLPATELGPLAPLLQANPRAKYLSIGWGNRRFYMAAHPGSGDALAALFRSPSVLFVQGAAAPSDLSDANVRWLCANRDQIWRLDHYVNASLSRGGGRPVDLGSGPLSDSHFYASTGHYSAIHTCNTWIVAALEYAGLPVRAGGVILASQVDGRVRKLRACPAP